MPGETAIGAASIGTRLLQTQHTNTELGCVVEANPKSAAAEADLIIKNTYRTLMTRGMKGCYVCCSDEETASDFRDRLSPGVLAAVQP